MLVQEIADDDEDEKVTLRRTSTASTRLDHFTQSHTPQDFQSKFCATLRAMVVTHRLFRRCCKKCCIKDRVLGHVFKANKDSMYIHNVLKLLRVMEGIMKEKLEISKKEWRKHWVEYGPLRYVKSSDEEEQQQQNGKEMEIEFES